MSVAVAVLVILSFSLQPVVPLVAFDCNGKDMNYTSISLVTTPPSKPLVANTTYRRVVVSVSQSETSFTLPLVRCKVETINYMFRCGQSIDTMHSAGLFTKVLSVSRDEFYEMIKTRKYVILASSGKTEVTLQDGLTRISLETRGSISSGSCNPGIALVRGGKTYDRPVITTQFSIEISEGTGLVDVEEDSIKLLNGNPCVLKSESV